MKNEDKGQMEHEVSRIAYGRAILQNHNELFSCGIHIDNERCAGVQLFDIG